MTFRGRVNQREMSALFVVFVEVSRKIHACDSLQMHRELHKSVINSLSCAWSWPNSVFARLSFSPTLSVVFCVAVKKYVISLVWNHSINHWLWVVWFKEAKIVGVGRPKGYYHITADIIRYYLLARSVAFKLCYKNSTISRKQKKKYEYT